MKIGSQVYVRGSIEAVDMYCEAFGAEITFHIKSAENTYEHCELSVNGHFFMCVSEAPADCERTRGQAWQTMAFNVNEMGTEEAVRNAYEVLCEGGKVLHLGPRPWSAFCTDIVDKFGVFWWIAI